VRKIKIAEHTCLRNELHVIELVKPANGNVNSHPGSLR
jgi:hypothetical protein